MGATTGAVTVETLDFTLQRHRPKAAWEALDTGEAVLLTIRMHPELRGLRSELEDPTLAGVPVVSAEAEVAVAAPLAAEVEGCLEVPEGIPSTTPVLAPCPVMGARAGPRSSLSQ